MDSRRNPAFATCWVTTVVLLALAVGCERPTVDSRAVFPPTEASPVDEVRAEMAAICRGSVAGDDPYYGRAQIAELERYLLFPVREPLPRLVVRARLAMEKLRVGENEEAVRLLEEAHRIALEGDVETAVLQDVTRRLGLARLRSGEQTNCIGFHEPASCILPFSDTARHRDPSGSLGAIDSYREYLAREPASATVRWLLNLAAMTVGRHPASVPYAWRVDPTRLRSEQSIGEFVDRAWSAGLRLRESSGGAVMDDFDGDNLLDVVASTIDPCSSLRAFHNRGDGSFSDVTEAWGLDSQLGGLNLVHADYDNDGDLDLLVLRGGWFGAHGRMRNSLLRNDGHGRFDDVTRSAGITGEFPTQTAAFADYDNDGDLDLYVGNESEEQLYLEGNSTGKAWAGQLFRNAGNGTFVDVASEAGVANERFAKGVAWGDYDNDGDPDLYVSNLGPNRLYRNEGDGTFRDVAPDLGLTEPASRSFATWFFDYDNDGWQDLFVTDYGALRDHIAAYYLGAPSDGTGRPYVYRNEGDGTFTEQGERLGFTVPTLPMGANFGDLDEDGWLDVWLGTGDPSFESLIPNLVYRNDEGRAFRDVTFASGVGHLQKGHAVAIGDVDNDGDQDVFEQMGGAYPGDAYPSTLFENPGHERSWISLRLIGVRSNRFGIGTRIRVTVATPEGTRSIHRTVGSGGSFGGSSLIQEIGLGRAGAIDAIHLSWPASGTEQVFHHVPLNGVFEIREGEKRLRSLKPKRFRLAR